ncbi:map kinase kinase kinase ssk2-related-related [Anaeramoeba flamelloides]|uniref:Map kinase kinase kinase ssk2-related-related n=1 Tax=Anaeramoeba flamelloides TaxID=1746091 RepID=A0AAV7ZL14_9EUKA|nr:map kinase kinase kinase ssk2-related-related [Anaeramoeba flamelloides]
MKICSNYHTICKVCLKYNKHCSQCKEKITNSCKDEKLEKLSIDTLFRYSAQQCIRKEHLTLSADPFRCGPYSGVYKYKWKRSDQIGIVMEYLSGGSLNKLYKKLSKDKESDINFPLVSRLELAEQILCGLEFLQSKKNSSPLLKIGKNFVYKLPCAQNL